ncbi:MAG: penicillin-binding transpeptidase domain-containing protein [Patescibacteria group bacterium]
MNTLTKKRSISFQKSIPDQANVELQKRNILFGIVLTFVVVLMIYIFNLQLMRDNSLDKYIFTQDVLRPQRGQIFLQNYALNSPKALTISNYSTKVIINPDNIKKIIVEENNTNDIVEVLSSILTIQSKFVNEKLTEALKTTGQYFVLFQNISSDQSIKLKQFLNEKTYVNSDYAKYKVNSWLSYEDSELRIYPEKNLAGPVLGYTSENYWSNEDIRNEKRCQDLLEKNKNFQANGYKVGLSGIEGSFCSKINGTNGLRNLQLASNGEDVYLTLDYNLQKEAERINQKIITDNSNSRGKPKNAVALIVEVNNNDPNKNGRVLAMASNPTFDPNNYSSEFVKNPESFLNYATDVPYESGSVIKPLMVGSLLDQYYQAIKDDPTGNCTTNKKLCVSPNWTFEDKCGGKVYNYTTESIRIKNYNNNCFPGTNGLKEVLRDSINTGIADMSQYITSEVMKEYFVDKYKFGSITNLNTYNESSGNTKTFKDNYGYNINNAYLGFGQSFTNTPVQLAQAYIPFLSDGWNFPVNYLDNNKVSNPEKVIKTEVTNLVKNYMAATSNEGYYGQGSGLVLDGYGNGTKTGTAQIAKSNILIGPDQKPLLDEKGKEKRVWCGYDCNSEKGLYEHTMVGFAPVNKPRLMLILKVSEPRPYESANTSANQVLAKPWKELMQYSLEYLKIPKEY